jgi:hypothetical protein
LGESVTCIGIPETFAVMVEENLLGGHIVTVKNGSENASFLFSTLFRPGVHAFIKVCSSERGGKG